MLGAFAVHIGTDDKKSPLIRTDIIGRHKIGSGASPQAVMQVIVADPLAAAGLNIGDVDVFSAEMQNPEITEPAGAGDVPGANYKMIAALGVMRGEFERSQLAAVVEKIGMPGFAPTQGHIPSGVPFLAHCREMMLANEIKRAMIIGKGSLFLGRLTNLFDGVSLVLEANPGEQARVSLSGALEKTRLALPVLGSEHPATEVIRGAELAMAADPLLEVVLIGAESAGMESVPVATAEEALHMMDQLLTSNQVQAAVAMHYAFPLGVSTVGRVITPARGRKLYLANTTGASATERTEALVRNAIGGIAVAKACGNAAPSLGLLNLEGARQAERILRQLRENGYAVNFAESGRADGGAVMRGNDLLQGVPDIMVCDSLTGNVLMKLLSAYSSGGGYEALGDGYGPGVGERYGKIVNIISRASGAPVIAGALAFAAQAARGGLPKLATDEFAAAMRAGLKDLLAANNPAVSSGSTEEIAPPPEKVVAEEITGVEVFAIEDAVRLLWKNGLYAAAGMGCTGPVVMVAEEDKEQALHLLSQGGYL
jgi:betaine reductase